jgi:hypothetical protein
MGGICEVSLEMVSHGMVYIPSFMKTGLDIQAILKFCFSSLEGCNVFLGLLMSQKNDSVLAGVWL